MGRRKRSPKPHPNEPSGYGSIGKELMTVPNREMPRPNLYSTFDGRIVGTELYRDRIWTHKPQVIVPTMALCLEGVAKSHWFQLGVNIDNTLDASVGGVVANLYTYIVRELASHSGKLFSIRDTTLANSGAFNSMPAWLENYSTAFLILRCLQSLLKSANTNETLSIASSAVNANLPALIAASERLAMLSVPTGWMEILDSLCGVKALDADSPVFVAGLPSKGGAGGLYDIVSSTDIATLIGLAQANITSCLTGAGGALAFAPNDAQVISNIMAYAYGEPKLPPKGISSDVCEYAMQRNQMITFHDRKVDTVGAAKTFSSPNLNITIDVPIFVPKGTSGTRTCKQLLSLLRPAVYSIDPLAGLDELSLPNQTGIATNWGVATGSGNMCTLFGIYYQDSVVHEADEEFSGPGSWSYANFETEMFFFAGIAAHEDVDYTSAQSSWAGYDRILLANQWLFDNTLYELERVFLEPLRQRGGAFV